jgi:hypothetical protein
MNASIFGNVAMKLAANAGSGTLPTTTNSPYGMTYDRGQFVGRTANSFVVRQGDSGVIANIFQPLFVGTVGWEQIMVALNSEAGCGERVGGSVCQGLDR